MVIRNKLLSCTLICILAMHIFYNPLYAQTTSLPIKAESAILMDARSGEVLYGKNINTRQYPASITKLMTALIAIENKKPTDMITFSKDAVFGIEPGSSHIGLDVGEQITLDQGLHGLLLMSANEVANGIAELCDGSISNFAKHMTEKAKELGAKDTNFANPHGLHNPNHYTTAYDMALIARAISQEPYFLEIMKNIKYQIPPTNKTAEIRYLAQQHRLMNEQRDGRMYRKDVIGGKTGYTDQARHTLVTIAKRGNIELIAVVLKAERDCLYTDTNTLLDYGFNNYKSVSLHTKDDVIQTIPMFTIKSGQLIHMADCNIATKQNVVLLVPENVKERKINPVISLPNRTNKDAGIGDVIGTVSYMYEDKLLSTSDLVIQSLNHKRSLEPFDFPQKPKYDVPAFQILLGQYISESVMLLGIGLIIVVLGLFVHTKYSRRNPFKKSAKKLLRFSKSIK